MSLPEQVISRSMDNVLEYLALFYTSRLQSLIVFCLTSNDKNGLINVTSDKKKKKVLLTEHFKSFFLCSEIFFVYIHIIGIKRFGLISKQIGQTKMNS